MIRTIDYAHPVYTAAGVAAQRTFGEISARNRTHFCGAYWGWGFHEDGVVSALRVAELGLRSEVRCERVSAMYTGTIRHRRTGAPREFRHRLALAYIDLAELPALLGGRLLRRRPGRAAVPPPRLPRRPGAVPLDAAVRDRVPELGGRRPRARSACSPSCARSGCASTR